MIDGRAEHRDVMFTRSDLHLNWWRKDGHSLCEADPETVFAEPPATLVVGSDTQVNMRPEAGLLDILAARGITTEVMPTAEAVKRYNELVGLDVDVAAALHLTC